MSGFRRWMRLAPSSERERREEMAREIDAHIAMRVDDLMQMRGMSAEQALREAHRRFGNVDQAQRLLAASANTRDRRLAWSSIMDAIRNDIRHAVREMKRRPMAALLSILTFAVGIGLTTAMYTIVDRVVMRPLPYPQSDELVVLMAADSAGNTGLFTSSLNWRDWRDNNTTLAGTALISSGYGGKSTIAFGDAVTRASMRGVVGDFFEVTGMRLQLGRPLRPEDTDMEPLPAVVSADFFSAVMGSDSSFSRPLVVNGRQRQVVGVLDEGQEFPSDVDIWVPSRPEYASMAETPDMRNWMNWTAIGRLKEGVNVEQASQDLSRIAQNIHRANPTSFYSFGVQVETLHSSVIGSTGEYIWMVLGAIALIALIACANLGAINYARALNRQRDTAVRLALGATRRRIFAQVMTEQVVTAVLGAAVGLYIAIIATSWMSRRAIDVLPRSGEVAIDARVLMFTLIATIIACVVAGIAPAIRLMRTVHAQISSSRGSIGGLGTLGRFVVIGEVALCAMLLCGSGLLLRSFIGLSQRGIGIESEGVTFAEVPLFGARYDSTSSVLAFWPSLVQSLEADPAIDRVSIANGAPTFSSPSGFIRVPGVNDDRAFAGYRVIGDNYFATLGMRLVKGRDFGAQDGPGTPRTVVVNETMAQRYWPGQDPLGKVFYSTSTESYQTPEGAPPLTVIGVVSDIRHYGLQSEPMPEMYVAYDQVPDRARYMTIVARGRDDVRVADAIRRTLQQADPSIAPDIKTLDRALSQMIVERRVITSIITSFGILALLISSIGIFSLLSMSVAQRMREMGVRAMLGAQPRDIMRMLIGGTVGLVAIGAVIGLSGAYWGSRLLESLLFETSRFELGVVAATAGALLLTGVAAALAPALRAASVDPLQVL